MLTLLFVVLLITLLALMMLVSTVGLTPAAISTLTAAPSQLRTLLGDRRVRRNHALEHATINVIEERIGPGRLAGLARADGFVIRGGAGPELVASAAEEAARRLRAGERRLALRSRCGTSLLAALVLAGLLFLVVVVVTRQFSWLAIGVATAAVLLAPRLSLLLQRFLTTDPDIGPLSVAQVEPGTPSGRLGLLSLVVLGPVVVRTVESASERRQDASEGGRVTVITGDREEVVAGRYRVR